MNALVQKNSRLAGEDTSSSTRKRLGLALLIG
jgi:hypothetical protein